MSNYASASPQCRCLAGPLRVRSAADLQAALPLQVRSAADLQPALPLRVRSVADLLGSNMLQL
jgi:hypothetical protein